MHSQENIERIIGKLKRTSLVLRPEHVVTVRMEGEEPFIGRITSARAGHEDDLTNEDVYVALVRLPRAESEIVELEYELDKKNARIDQLEKLLYSRVFPEEAG